MTITISGAIGTAELDKAVAHEGSHARDRQEAVAVWFASGDYVKAYNAATNVTQYQGENRAYRVGAYMAKHLGEDELSFSANPSYKIWTRATNRVDQTALDGLLHARYKGVDGKGLSSTNQGERTLPPPPGSPPRP